MLIGLRRRLAAFESAAGNEAVAEDLHRMVPGMAVEQAAAVLLDIINIAVMGFVSTAAIAGVGQINTVNNVLMNLFQAFAIGGTAAVAQRVGAGRDRNAAQAAGSAILLGLGISLALTALLFAFHRQLVGLLFGSAESVVLGSSIAYFRLTCLAPPLWFLYFQCCGFLRAAGDTRRPMLISIALNGSAMALNVFFSLGLGLGPTGAGLAYLLSVLLAALISLYSVLRKGSPLRPRFSRSEARAADLRQIAGVSFPSAAENLMFNGSRLIVQICVAGMGTAMISANSVFQSVNGIFNIPVMTLYYLTVPVIGRCAGAGNCSTVRSGLRFIARKTLVWSIPVALAHLLLGWPACWLFTRDAEVVRIATGILWLYAPAAVLQAASFILPNGFKAVGDARFAMAVSALSAWVFKALGSWLLGVQLGFGAYANALTSDLDTAFRGAVFTRRFRNGHWLKQIGK